MWNIIKGQMKQFLSQLETSAFWTVHPQHGGRKSARQLNGPKLYY